MSLKPARRDRECSRIMHCIRSIVLPQRDHRKGCHRWRLTDGMYSGFLDIGAPDGYVFQLQPTILNADNEPMLQLADIVAYVCSHAADKSTENTFFREQRDRFRYWSRSVLEIA